MLGYVRAEVTPEMSAPTIRCNGNKLSLRVASIPYYLAAVRVITVCRYVTYIGASNLMISYVTAPPASSVGVAKSGIADTDRQRKDSGMIGR